MEVQASLTITKIRTTCARCGASFVCAPEGACWCEAEPARLPMPGVGEGCLCPACLRAAAVMPR